MDPVLWDLKQPLPFRKINFDAICSVSAIHFLCGPQDEEQRCRNFFSSLYAMHSMKKFSFQFFPEIPFKLLQAARKAGFSNARLVLDHTHHTKAFRWYLINDEAKNKSNCRLYSNFDNREIFLPPEENVSCCLQIENGGIERSHEEWVKRDHVKRARHLLRKFKHDPSLISNKSTIKLVTDLIESFGIGTTTEELQEPENLQKLLHILHY
eukprot:snap_masked-scaffold_5-processed-gene-8.63-mRNA-1 protein AED:1.00 eAED:1.00 QI:0/0/0/0/1/1/2/0/209